MPRLRLRLLGPLVVLRDGMPVPLPSSRKVRALLAYLAVAPQPVSRERLCALFWEVPNDPRGELRWCLSKLRSFLDDPARRRVQTTGDRVWLDLDDCDLDVRRLLGAVGSVPAVADLDGLQQLTALCGADFLEGIEHGGSVEFDHWLSARRSEFRSHQIGLLAEVSRRLPHGTSESLSAVRQWLDLAPSDAEAHARFLAELFGRRQLADCMRHLEAAERLFADEGADFAPVRKSWDEIRRTSTQQAPPPAGGPAVEPAQPLPQSRPEPPGASRRGSVAVMPFRELREGTAGPSGLGNALAHDIISRLAKLRSLFVISRGSVFALAEEALDVQEIARRLGVDYVTTGFLERRGDIVLVTAEVADAASARIIWTERFEARHDEQFAVLDEIGDGIVSSVAAEIENAERNRAILKHPDSLDAWEAYHRGLWHMYHFTAGENVKAAALFRRATELDPTFSRAFAGLSFTHWQNAFQRWNDRDMESRQALEAAGRSLLLDDQNPAAHWSMGRALWLVGDAGEAIRELERSVSLSPNFAQGHYALSFVHCQSGDPAAAIASSDYSRLLSPCDPLLFGMLGTRAMALVRMGALDEAAEWAVKAAARPNAHVHILAMAAHCLAMAGRLDEAHAHVARIRGQNPRYRSQDLLGTFRFDADAEARYRGVAARIGLGE
ncbi:MAG: transcriptional regulator [Pseudomonadota bacterium]